MPITSAFGPASTFTTVRPVGEPPSTGSVCVNASVASAVPQAASFSTPSMAIGSVSSPALSVRGSGSCGNSDAGANPDARVAIASAATRASVTCVFAARSIRESPPHVSVATAGLRRGSHASQQGADERQRATHRVHSLASLSWLDLPVCNVSAYTLKRSLRRQALKRFSRRSTCGAPPMSLNLRPTPEQDRPSAPRRQQNRRRWLLFVHQLPSSPSNLRVRTWRRLQDLGAMVIKQAVYVLPDSPGAREDFEWLKAEIEGAGGHASVFAADSVDAWSDDALVEEFRRSRQGEYAGLARDIERALRRPGPGAGRRRGPAASWRRRLERFWRRLTAIEHIDFFGSAGRDRVVTLLERLTERLSGAAPRPSANAHPGKALTDAYRRRLWVTRPRPGVDRMA